MTAGEILSFVAELFTLYLVFRYFIEQILKMFFVSKYIDLRANEIGKLRYQKLPGITVVGAHATKASVDAAIKSLEAYKEKAYVSDETPEVQTRWGD